MSLFPQTEANISIIQPSLPFHAFFISVYCITQLNQHKMWAISRTHNFSTLPLNQSNFQSISLIIFNDIMCAPIILSPFSQVSTPKWVNFWWQQTSVRTIRDQLRCLCIITSLMISSLLETMLNSHFAQSLITIWNNCSLTSSWHVSSTLFPGHLIFPVFLWSYWLFRNSISWFLLFSQTQCSRLQFLDLSSSQSLLTFMAILTISITLNSICILKFLPPNHIYPPNPRVGISIWIFNRHIKLNVSKTELEFFLPNPQPFYINWWRLHLSSCPQKKPWKHHRFYHMDFTSEYIHNLTTSYHLHHLVCLPTCFAWITAIFS